MPDAHPQRADLQHTLATAPVQMMPVPVMLQLLQLRRMMLAEGRQVDLQRLCLDLDYAQQCLADAHTSSDVRLRQAALALFDACSRTPTPPALH